MIGAYQNPALLQGTAPRWLRFCGRSFSEKELRLIQEIARDYAALGITEIARTVCELLDWKRANGRLKDQECRQLLERLRDEGWLSLPAVRNSGPRGPRQVQLTEASAVPCTVEGSVGEFLPLQLQVIEGRSQSRLWTELIERYHYLRYRVPVGANLRYWVRSPRTGEQVLACLLWSSAAWKMAPRDAWIGWNQEQRIQNLPLLVNNSRFLILPGRASAHWPARSWHSVHANFPSTGSFGTDTVPFYSKLWWMPGGFAAHAIERQTGSG